MENNSKLTELLSRDSESREFFSGLSPQLRRRLIKQDISNFKTLKAGAECYADKPCGSPEPELYACSATECTGLIPEGSDRSEEQWKEYGNITPFGID